METETISIISDRRYSKSVETEFNSVIRLTRLSPKLLT